MGTIGVSRRAVARGTVWAVPVVLAASAAPAYAASNCLPVTLYWSAFVNDALFNSTTVGGVRVSLRQANIVNPQDVNYDGEPNNGRIYGSTLGGTSKSLTFAVYPTFGGAGTTPTISFDQPVTDVQFTFLDIDASVGFQDQVTISTPGYTVVSMGSTITRSGNTFSGNGLVPSTSTSGNLAVRWAGPVSNITFSYRQGYGDWDSAFIGISDITFTPSVC